jgi:dihydrofolate synthase/folylpolyglutamate synthase
VHKTPVPHLSLGEWLDRLASQHPTEIDLGLDRVLTVAEALGVLRGAPKTITVAGTNGKGSVVALLTAGLKAMGQVVGTYASPHLLRFNERISIDEAEADDAEIVAAFEHIEAVRGDVSLTYFESATLAALWLFRQRDVDVQVLEVGLGGRLDAVNILDADVSVITSIGLDHTDWLGPDRAAISLEKAGVARQNRPCIVAESDPPDALLAALDDRGAETLLIGRDWRVGDTGLLTAKGRSEPLPAASGLLASNIGAAIQALEVADCGEVTEAVLLQMEGVQLLGRLSQRIMNGVEYVFDVAHNTESVKALVHHLAQTNAPGATRAVFAVMGDKPIHDMISACEGVFDEWNVIDLPQVPRAQSPAELIAVIGQDRVGDTGPLERVWETLKGRCTVGDRVVIFGSFLLVGDAFSIINNATQAGERA